MNRLPWIRLFRIIMLSLFIAPSLQAKPVLLSIGDSLTFGLGVNSDKTWPNLLQNKLRADGFKTAEVINAGSSGATTAVGLSTLKFHLKRSKPDLIIYALGANDGLRAIDTETTYKNVSAAIAEIQKAGIKVLLIGMKAPPNYGEKFPKDYEKVFSRVASEKKIPFIPFLLEGVAGDPTLNQADGIHPNDKGYETIIEKIYPSIKAQL
ncbi:MAG: arylesterase [Proteobacteria bacterium]|nr:MAG: arylesterase [Pseudomonadota bacterium]